MKITNAVGLEGRELDFVFLICCGYAPTSAAKGSGWAVGSASRLLGKPEILAAILSMGRNADKCIATLRSRRAKVAADYEAPGLQVARPREPVETY